MKAILHLIGPTNQDFIPRYLALIKDKSVTASKIILAGDFFHSKASKIGSMIGITDISRFLAQTEESQAIV